MSQPWIRPIRRGPRFVPSVEDLAALVPDGAHVSIGGFHFVRQPIRLVEAIAARRPRGLTHVQWGGSLGLEILLEAGAVDHLVFCFDSLELFGSAPNFRAGLESGRVTAEEYTALELHHALLAAVMNLPGLPLQAPVGSWRVKDPPPDGLVVSPAIEVDIVLLHAQRADDAGNVEIRGAQGLDRTLAFAGRRVLVTVEEIVEEGTFTDRAAVIPRQFVEAIAVVRDGAWPTSCQPFYSTDFQEVARRVSNGRFAADRSGSFGTVARHASETVWRRVEWPTINMPVPLIADLMVAWLARRLDDTSMCSVGSASSIATVAYLVAKADHAPGLTLVTHNGGYIDVASRFASLSFGEASDFQTAAVVCGGDDSYRWFYQQSRVTDEVVGAAQIDAHGRTNNGWIDLGDGRRVRLPGQGGMADVANMHRNFILYSPRQSRRQLVDEVDWMSASRGLLGEAERAAMGYGPGEVVLITDLAVFRLDPATKRFAAESIHPGISVEQLSAATGWSFEGRSPIPTTQLPTDREMATIRRVDPFGLRGLEFLPARDRLGSIQAVLRSEAAFLEGIVA